MTKAEQTRLAILGKAFSMIYQNGYQATSIDDIIASTEVTKGAFYYHFKSKDDMGLAMINEVMYPGMYQLLVAPLLHSQEPVTDIYEMMQSLLSDNKHFQVKFGCPAINLIEEMPPLNEAFKKALQKLAAQWQDAIQQCIVNGIASKKIRKDVNPKQVAHFITAGYGGIRNMGKIFGRSCYTFYLDELKNYLEQLR